jgi:hypothetical protein
MTKKVYSNKFSSHKSMAPKKFIANSLEQDFRPFAEIPKKVATTNKVNSTR